MSREEILTKLQSIFRDVFSDDSLEITENTSPEDVEDWDSIGHVYLTVQIEEQFGLELGEKMQEVGNVADIIDLIIGGGQ